MAISATLVDDLKLLFENQSRQMIQLALIGQGDFKLSQQYQQFKCCQACEDQGCVHTQKGSSSEISTNDYN